MQQYIPIIVYLVIIATISQIVHIINGIVSMVRNDIRGRRIFKRRVAARITQRELAAFSGIPEWKINLIEHGDSSSTQCYKILLWSINEYSNPC